MSEGAKQILGMSEAGFTAEEIVEFEAGKRGDMEAAGFAQEEIDTYFGTPPFDAAPVKTWFNSIKNSDIGKGKTPDIEGFLLGGEGPDPSKPTPGFGEFFESGAEQSIFGMATTGKPDPVENRPDNVGMLNSMLEQGTTLVGDLPFYLLGGFIGGGLGGGVGTATAGPVGTLPGATVGAATGTFAFPAMLRKSFTEMHEKGAVKDFDDWWGRFSAIALEMWHEGLVGGSLGVAGKIPNPVARFPAEVGTLVAVGNGLRGEMPQFEDFEHAAILLLGLKGGHKLTSQAKKFYKDKLIKRYVETGEKPLDVLKAAEEDPSIETDLASRDLKLKPALKEAVEELTPAQKDAEGAVPSGAEADKAAVPSGTAIPNSLTKPAKEFPSTREEFDSAVIYQGVRESARGDKIIASGDWTTDIDVARVFGRREGGGLLRVALKSDFEKGSFHDVEGVTLGHAFILGEGGKPGRAGQIPHQLIEITDTPFDVISARAQRRAAEGAVPSVAEADKVKPLAPGTFGDPATKHSPIRGSRLERIALDEASFNKWAESWSEAAPDGPNTAQPGPVASRYYAQKGSSSMNRLLRGHDLKEFVGEERVKLSKGEEAEPGTTTLKEDIRHIKALRDAIDNSPLPEDVTVFRGLVKDFNDVQVGDIVDQGGFISTTLEPTIANMASSRNEGNVILRLKAFAGDKAAPGASGEAELIFQANTRMRVTRITKEKLPRVRKDLEGTIVEAEFIRGEEGRKPVLHRDFFSNKFNPNQITNPTELKEILTEGADFDTLKKIPLIKKVTEDMAALPRTSDTKGYGSLEYESNRVFDFNGEKVVGYDNIIERVAKNQERHSDGPVKTDKQLYIVTGPPASGKSTLAEKIIAKDKRATVIDSDEFKFTMKEYDGGKGTQAVHTESSRLSGFHRALAMSKGQNVVLPKVGESVESIEGYIKDFKQQGYDVHLINLDVSFQNALTRMVGRFASTGRFIPLEIVEAVGETPAENFQEHVKNGTAKSYAQIDGNGPKDTPSDILFEQGEALAGITGLGERVGRGGEGGVQGRAGEVRSEEAQAIDAVANRVSTDIEPSKRYNAQEFIKQMVDEIDPLRRLTKILADGETLPTGQDPGQMAQMLAGVSGKAEYFFQHGTFKYGTYEIDGKSLREIVTMPEAESREFEAYLIAKRVVADLEPRGIKTGVPLDKAKIVVEQLEGNYRQRAKDLYEFKNAVLQYAVDAGLYSQAAVDAMIAANPHHIQFYRKVKGGGRGPSASLSPSQPIKKIKGSELELVPVLESVIKDTYQIISLAERNAVAESLLTIAERHPKGEDFVQVKEKFEGRSEATDRVEALAEEYRQGNGVTVASEDVMRAPGTFVNAKDEITVYREGKRITLKVSEEVADVFKGMDRESSSLLVEIMSKPAKLLRAGAVLSPDFIARNPFRDQFTAGIFSDSGFFPFLDLGRGIFHILNQSNGVYKDWLRSGGPMSSLVSLDRKYLQTNIKELQGQTGFMDSAVNVMRHPVEVLRVLSELMERGTRVGEFDLAQKQLRKQGATEKEAILTAGARSREVTLDFSRMGSKGRAINRLVAFFNAGIQGDAKTLRGFKEHPVRTTARVAAMITIPSVILYMHNREEPDWGEIPQWQKDLFWLIKVPGVGNDFGPSLFVEHTRDGTWFRLPKPFGIGILFGSGAERITEKILSDDPDAGKGLLENFGKSVSPLGMPQALLPYIEGTTNHSFFRDSKIISMSREGLLPEYKYTGYTTELAKQLGKLVARVPWVGKTDVASPALIENTVNLWTGGLGRYVLQLADAGLRKAGLLPDPVRPSDTLADIPFIKAFVVRDKTGSSQSIQDFYEKFEVQQQTQLTIKALIAEGEVDEATALLDKAVSEGLFLPVQGIQKGLSSISKLVRMVWRNPDMGRDEKRQTIDNLYGQMIALAKAGNKMIDEGIRQAKQTQVEKAKEEQKQLLAPPSLLAGKPVPRTGGPRPVPLEGALTLP